MTALQCARPELAGAPVAAPKPGRVARIADARPRAHVVLAGTIRATETATAGGSPLFRCVLADGTGEADLLFLGRSRVGGLTAGTCCRAEGRATVRNGRLAVWNPRYEAGPAARPGRVLVVDDQPAMRRVLELSLAAHGYRVDSAATGAAALARARQEPPDLMILDLGLPDLDGLQVIAEVRTFSAVPIVVMSARDAEAAEARARAAGADDYLTKPFEIGQLVSRVRAALPSAAGRARGGPGRAPD
ncbi:MAG TPA: response regulator [Streptosporangiaceae bacterium]